MGFALNTPQSKALAAVGITAPVLASLAVFGRFWARNLKNIPPALDDWLLLPALVGTTRMALLRSRCKQIP